MKITFDWLKDHLDTKLKEDKLLKQLTNVGLEVESIENLSTGLDLFKVAKILKTEKHPNADRLKVCEVNVGEKELKKVNTETSNNIGRLVGVKITTKGQAKNKAFLYDLEKGFRSGGRGGSNRGK